MKPAARAVALVAMAGTLCAASVFAEESALTPTSNNNASSLRVVVDPETGEVRAPTQEELLALIQAEQAARATQQTARARSAQAGAPTDVLPAAKSVERHPNGMLSVKLPQDSLSLVKAKTDEHGNTRTAHASETSTVAPAQEK